MAEDLTTTGPTPSSGQSLVEPPSPPPWLDGPDRERHSSAGRFTALIGVLIAIGVVALLLAVGLATSKHSSVQSQKWSEWKPTTGGVAGLQQMADQVASEYKAADDTDLTQIRGSEVQVRDAPAEIVVRGPDGRLGAALLDGETAMYTICGLGRDCSLRAPQTATDTLLLRHQAIKLALYTFHYMPGVEIVLVLMPPTDVGSGVKTTLMSGQKVSTSGRSTALLFSRKDMSKALEKPLDTLLPPVTDLRSWLAGGKASDGINKIANARNFLLDHIASQNGGYYYVLDPIKCSGPARTCPSGEPAS